MSRRRPPLHPCGVLISEIARRACKRVQGFTWPIGAIAQKTTKLAESRVLPFFLAIQYQWLAILSFADDQILAVVTKIETLFPPAHQLFDKMDRLICTMETLPEKLDEEAEKFPAIIHKVPFMDWALICLITWLKFLISGLTHWGISTNNTNEKEIVIDTINSTNLTRESNSLILIYDSSQDKPETKCEEHCCMEETKHTVLLPVSDISENETTSFQAQIKPGVERCSYAEVAHKPEVEKGSYWEVLMKGIQEKTEKDEYCLKKKHNPIAITGKRAAVESRKKMKQDGENESRESIEVAEEDSLLELFAASWHKETWKKKQKKGKY